jgi:hypothetical protein
MNAENRHNGRFGGPGIFQRKVNLWFAVIGQWDVGFDEELATGKSARAQTGLGPFGPGDGDPYVTLLLGERAPTGGDSAEVAADRDLSRGAGVERDKGGVADLAISSALPDCVSAFTRFGIGHFHN